MLKGFEEDGRVPLVPWMDEISAGLAREALESEARAGGNCFVVVELQRFDHPVRCVGRKRDPAAGLERRRMLAEMGGLLRKRDDALGVPMSIEVRSALAGLSRWRPFTWPQVSDERILIWRHREALRRNPDALMMFLKSVDWVDEEEVGLVGGLLERWAPLGPAHVLELACLRHPTEPSHRALLWKLLIGPAMERDPAAFKPFLPQLLQMLFAPGKGEDDLYPDGDSGHPMNCLASFLIRLAVEDGEEFATRLFWSLRVAARSTGRCANRAARLQGLFLGSLAHAKGPQTTEHLYQQVGLFGKLEKLLAVAKKQRSTRQQKQAVIMEALDDPAGGFLAFPPLPFPLDPQIMVTGILADRTVLFKSNALPLKLCFVATDPSAELMLLPVIFKEGDDLRQDQLVLELIGLIDRIWKRNRLDLRLTPYRVLPTAVTTGLVEFVPSQPLRAILADFNGSLRSYFRFLSSSKHHPGGDFDTLPIDPAILENYLRSAAGYSVLTYVLGVGDRHLENLLMTEDGRLFHVDFTFCFGRDPKPFPPPMKLCREMVEAMRSTERNGAELEGPTAEFCQFKAFCFTAFALLRRNARELLACIALLKNCGTTDLGMANASDQSQSHAMPHATVEAGLEVSRATVFVQDRLMLGLSEEEALRELDALIEESVTALFPQVLETIHKWAQYWRS